MVLEKDRDHKSSTYSDAPMPNMNRLTWSGIALHAGKLPGYPASHGCVRLPLDFSAKLFTVTHLGTPVIIASTATVNVAEGASTTFTLRLDRAPAGTVQVDVVSNNPAATTSPPSSNICCDRPRRTRRSSWATPIRPRSWRMAGLGAGSRK